MTASGAATLPQPKLEAQTPSAAEGFFNGVGLIGLIALAPASIVFLSFSQGGFFPDSTGLAAIGFAVALVLRTTLAEHPFVGFNRSVGVVLLALALFGGLQLASALWSHDTARALDEYDRTLLYLLALALFGTLSLSEALILGVVLAPTDAGLGQAVVTDPRLPETVRQSLNVEITRRTFKPTITTTVTQASICTQILLANEPIRRRSPVK